MRRDSSPGFQSTAFSLLLLLSLSSLYDVQILHLTACNHHVPLVCLFPSIINQPIWNLYSSSPSPLPYSPERTQSVYSILFINSLVITPPLTHILSSLPLFHLPSSNSSPTTQPTLQKPSSSSSSSSIITTQPNLAQCLPLNPPLGTHRDRWTLHLHLLAGGPCAILFLPRSFAGYYVLANRLRSCKRTFLS